MLTAITVFGIILVWMVAFILIPKANDVTATRKDDHKDAGVADHSSSVVELSALDAFHAEVDAATKKELVRQLELPLDLRHLPGPMHSSLPVVPHSAKQGEGEKYINTLYDYYR